MTFTTGENVLYDGATAASVVRVLADGKAIITTGTDTLVVETVRLKAASC